VDLDARHVARDAVILAVALFVSLLRLEQLTQVHLTQRAPERVRIERTSAGGQSDALRGVARQVVAIGTARIPHVRFRAGEVHPDVLRRTDERQIARFRHDQSLSGALLRESGEIFLVLGSRERAHLVGGARIGRLIAAAVGHENAFPLAGGGVDGIDVDHQIRVAGVEDARLDDVLDGRGRQLGLQLHELAVAFRHHVIDEVEVQHEHREAEEEHRPVDRARRDAERAHGHDFRVGGKAADGDQDAEQQRHRQREHDDVRQDEDQELADHGAGEGALDDQAGHVEELPHQYDRGIENEAEDRRPDHFLEHVAGEDLHWRGGFYDAGFGPERIPQSLVRWIMLSLGCLECGSRSCRFCMFQRRVCMPKR
jgi:hypothetical protein